MKKTTESDAGERSLVHAVFLSGFLAFFFSCFRVLSFLPPDIFKPGRLAAVCLCIQM